MLKRKAIALNQESEHDMPSSNASEPSRYSGYVWHNIVIPTLNAVNAIQSKQAMIIPCLSAENIER